MFACLIIEAIENFLEYIIPDLITFTPKVEVANDGCIYIDLGKPGAIDEIQDVFWTLKKKIDDVADNSCIYIDLRKCGSTNEIQNVFQTLKKKISGTQIGIGPNRFTSFVIANQAAPGTFLIVPPDHIEAFLTKQDISLLQIRPENFRRLCLLGIRTLGELAALKIQNLTAQFGKQGRLMAELERGIDPTPLTPYDPPTTHCKGACQTNIWEDKTGTNPSGEPISVDILSNTTGFPKAIYEDNQWLPIDAVIDWWRLETRWWSDHPENSCYFQVFASGEQFVLSHNIASQLWYRY